MPPEYRILIVTDLEGVCGVLDFDNWCLPEGRRNEEGCEFLTMQTNAAIAGFFDGGATAVTAWDGHGSGGSLRGAKLDDRAMLQRGQRPDWPCVGDFDALAFVGQHPKASTDQGHLSHTQTFAAIDVRINGISVGEYGELALAAWERGIPTIFVSGCEAMRREAQALTPEAVAVAAKFGLNPAASPQCDIMQARYSQQSAVHYAPGRACAMIRAGALEAMKKLRQSGKSRFTIPALAQTSAPWRVEAEYRRSCALPEHGIPELPARKIHTRNHDTIAEALREFYREIEWRQPDGDRVVAE